MSSDPKEYKRVTTNSLVKMKKSQEKISMLTAYDYSMAKVVDAAGVDVILVGDSASNVMSGHETTIPITLNQMIYHAAAVVRASHRPWLWLTYHLGVINLTPKKRFAHR